MEREKKLENDLEESEKIKNELIVEIEEIRRHKLDMLEPQIITSSKELRVYISFLVSYYHLFLA